MKIASQGANIRITWPRLGATIGTIMKIVITSDMKLAIARPEKRSRTTAEATIRAPDENTPCRNRAPSSTQKSWISTQASETAMYPIRPMNSGARRPNRSVTGPQTSCGAPKPST